MSTSRLSSQSDLPVKIFLAYLTVGDDDDDGDAHGLTSRGLM